VFSSPLNCFRDLIPRIRRAKSFPKCLPSSFLLSSSPLSVFALQASAPNELAFPPRCLLPPDSFVGSVDFPFPLFCGAFHYDARGVGPALKTTNTPTRTLRGAIFVVLLNAPINNCVVRSSPHLGQLLAFLVLSNVPINFFSIVVV